MGIEILVIAIAFFLFAYVHYASFRVIRQTLISIDANLAEISASVKSRQGGAIKQVILPTHF